MTAETAATVSIGALDAAIAAATGHLAEDEQRLAVAVFRLLSAGEPVSIRAAAAAAGTPESAAGQVLESWPAVYWDDQRLVTGFWGLALAGMPPHRIRRAATGLSAWCAWDPLFLALVVGDLQVTTTDPVTGETITYDIGQDGAITGASHPGTVLSFLRRRRGDDHRRLLRDPCRHDRDGRRGGVGAVPDHVRGPAARGTGVHPRRVRLSCCVA